MSSKNAEPSKSNANWNSTVGSAKQTVGDLTGIQSLSNEGKQQKLEGDTEYKAAQAQGYVQGLSDQVEGKARQIYGAVTGDESNELGGKAMKEKGEVQKEINKNV